MGVRNDPRCQTALARTSDCRQEILGRQRRFAAGEHHDLVAGLGGLIDCRQHVLEREPRLFAAAAERTAVFAFGRALIGGHDRQRPPTGDRRKGVHEAALLAPPSPRTSRVTPDAYCEARKPESRCRSKREKCAVARAMAGPPGPPGPSSPTSSPAASCARSS